MRNAVLIVAVCSVALVAGSVSYVWSSPLEPAAQAAAPQSKPPAPANPPAGAPAQPPTTTPAADGYTYESSGRRDPFMNVLASGTEPRATSGRGEGAAGWTVADISIRGIMQSKGTLIAMVQGPDKKTFLVHQGDKFLDGTVKTITPQALIIVQEVKDPLSLVKQWEIRKQLRTPEDAKP